MQVISKSWIWFCYAYSASLGWSNLVGNCLAWFGLVWMSLVWCSWVRFGMDEFGLVWMSSVWYGWVWFGVVEFSLVWMSLVWCGWVRFGVVEFGLVWWGWFLFGLEDELNFVWFGRWTLNNSESSGSAIQLSLRTCYISNCFSKGYRSTVIRAGGVTCPADW